MFKDFKKLRCFLTQEWFKFVPLIIWDMDCSMFKTNSFNIFNLAFELFYRDKVVILSIHLIASFFPAAGRNRKLQSQILFQEVMHHRCLSRSGWSGYDDQFAIIWLNAHIFSLVSKLLLYERSMSYSCHSLSSFAVIDFATLNVIRSLCSLSYNCIIVVILYCDDGLAIVWPLHD